MESLSKYASMSDDEESCTDIFTETSDFEKNKTTRSNKTTGKKNKTQPITSSKKIKLEKTQSSYMDKIGKLIEDENISNESINSLTVKQDGHNFIFKYPMSEGQDYWVLQHYKMADIENISSSDRWKHASCSIKIHTDQQNSKDRHINTSFQKMVEIVSERFVSDPKKKVVRHKLDVK